MLSWVQLLATPWTVATRLLHPWDFPVKNTGVDCHFLLQGIFTTQGSNPCHLHWQVGFLPLSHEGSVCMCIACTCIILCVCVSHIFFVCYIFFIHFSINGHRLVPCFGYVNSASMNEHGGLDNSSRQWFHFLQIYPEVRLLVTTVTIFNFLRNLCSAFNNRCYQMFPQCTSFPFLYILTSSCHLLFSDNSQPNMYEVIGHCFWFTSPWWSMMLNIFSCACWPFAGFFRKYLFRSIPHF